MDIYIYTYIYVKKKMNHIHDNNVLSIYGVNTKLIAKYNTTSRNLIIRKGDCFAVELLYICTNI